MSNTVLDLRDMTQSGAPARSEIVGNFIRSLAETAGARAIAADRLQRQDKRITELTAFCSVYLMILTVLPYLLSIPPEVTSYLDFFKIGLSIIILVTSVFKHSSNNYIKAEQLRRSGLDLNDLEREVEMRKDKLDLDDLDIIRLRYDNILQKYPVQHDRSDCLQYRIDNRQGYPEMGIFSALLTGMEISIRQSAPRAILIIISAIVIFFVVSLLGTYPARLPS
jgi:preprotein translocase subunit SecY